MLVYQNSVEGFLEDVDLNRIDTRVQHMVLQRLNMRVSESELRSWGSSLTRVAGPLRASHVALDATVSIECQLPMSSKRIDFILSGFGKWDEPQVVIIELKQWEVVKTTERDGLVETFIGGGIRATSHPSYRPGPMRRTSRTSIVPLRRTRSSYSPVLTCTTARMEPHCGM